MYYYQNKRYRNMIESIISMLSILIKTRNSSIHKYSVQILRFPLSSSRNSSRWTNKSPHHFSASNLSFPASLSSFHSVHCVALIQWSFTIKPPFKQSLNYSKNHFPNIFQIPHPHSPFLLPSSFISQFNPLIPTITKSLKTYDLLMNYLWITHEFPLIPKST